MTVYAADCDPCEYCGELICPECGDHYGDCPCPGPDSEQGTCQNNSAGLADLIDQGRMVQHSTAGDHVPSLVVPGSPGLYQAPMVQHSMDKG